MSLRDQLRIIVVDDMSTSRGLITQALDEFGISQVESAADAVARINPHVAVEAIDDRLDADNALSIVSRFDIVAGVQVNITDTVEEGLAPVKMMLAFYIGGMGAKGQNYHTKLMGRFGFEEQAIAIQDAFFEGRRDEAIAMVPDEFADAISLVGPPERIRDRLAAWDESPVSTLLVYATGDTAKLRQMAELVLG